MRKDKDLVSRVVKQLETDRKSAEAEKRKADQEEKIKEAQAPSIWQALGQWMKKLCEDCNAQARANLLEFKAGGSYEFDVVNHVPSQPNTLHVVFNPPAYTITYRRKSGGRYAKEADTTLELIKGKANGTFCPKVDGKKFCYTLPDDTTTTMTVEEMGEQLIKALVPELATG